MNKKDLVNYVREETGFTAKDVTACVNAVFDGIVDGMLNEGKVSITGFGSFEVKERAGRTGRNPQTGEPLEIPAAYRPKFNPGKNLKESILNFSPSSSDEE